MEFHPDVEFDRLPPVLEDAIYRIIQESLTNARKHSGSDRVRIELHQEEDMLQIEVQDWGRGLIRESLGRLRRTRRDPGTGEASWRKNEDGEPARTGNSNRSRSTNHRNGKAGMTARVAWMIE